MSPLLQNSACCRTLCSFPSASNPHGLDPGQETCLQGTDLRSVDSCSRWKPSGANLESSSPWFVSSSASSACGFRFILSSLRLCSGFFFLASSLGLPLPCLLFSNPLHLSRLRSCLLPHLHILPLRFFFFFPSSCLANASCFFLASWHFNFSHRRSISSCFPQSLFWASSSLPRNPSKSPIIFWDSKYICLVFSSSRSNFTSLCSFFLFISSAFSPVSSTFRLAASLSLLVFCSFILALLSFILAFLASSSLSSSPLSPSSLHLSGIFLSLSYHLLPFFSPHPASPPPPLLRFLTSQLLNFKLHSHKFIICLS